MSKHPFLYLELEGTSYEIGLQHGKALKETINKILDLNMKTLLEQSRSKGKQAISGEELLALTKRYLPYAREYSKDLMEEIAGIADGAGLDFEDVFCMNCHLDLRDLTYPFISQKLMLGCTTFGASWSATKAEQPLIGQTYDWGDIFQDGIVVFKIQRDNKPGVLVFSIAGMVGCAGMSSAGVSLVINRLVAGDSRPGVPYPFVVRKALEQERIGNALHAIANAKRASGLFYLLGDKHGEIIGLETSATDYDVFYPENDILTHTNNYVSPRMQEYALSKKFAGDTIFRLERSKSLMNRKHPQITVTDMQDMMRDHENCPNAICRHSNSQASELARSKTIAALITNPALQTMWIAPGNPCTVEFTEITLKG